MKVNKIIFKKLNCYIIFLWLILTISPFNLHAGVEHFTNKIELCEIENGAVFTVKDDKYPIMLLNPYGWQTTFKVKDYSKSRIILKYDETNKTPYLSGFTATANVSVTYVKQNLTTATFTTTLTLDYDPASGSLSTDQHIYDFNDAHNIDVTLTSISTDLPSSIIPDGLVLQAEIDVERYYPFNHSAIPSIGHSVVDVDGGIDRTLGLSWPIINGAEEYDLEWTFIDDYNSLASTKQIDFRNNATRVTLVDNYYEIPLVYEKGYILYRVRGVGKLAPDYTQRVLGTWSSDAFISGTVGAFGDKYYVNEHEGDNFNWGYQSFFTENGVRGEGVSYFDGLLKNRQNTSKLNSSDKVVIQETFYDYQGRPAVSALPTPYDERFFKYRTDFNKNSTGSAVYSASNFDLDVNSTPEMSTSTGASNYYSPLNPNQEGTNTYIPDAEGFPYTQTEYTNDLTGRIKRQGGLGDNHKIGSGNESEFYYGKPLQHKLTKLFGTDVGFSKAYSETMVIDPNGQASVSVMDASGKVIITNLAGDPPTNLEGLPSHAAKEQITTSILNNTPDYQDGYGSLISTQAYIVKAEGIHEFAYSLDPETYTDCLPSGVCYDCVYDLVISVKDAYSNTEMLIAGVPFVVTIGSTPLNNTCENSTYNSPTDNTLKVNLPIGSYIISKELRVNQTAIDYYADQYMQESTCLDDYHDFFDAFIAETDFSGCNQNPCLLSCEAEYGNSTVWLAANPTMDIDDYNDLIDDCMADCYSVKTPCEQYEYDMLADVSKGGQYGLYFDEVNLIVDVTIFDLSLFNIANKLPDNATNWITQTRGTGANWTNPAVNSAGNSNYYYESDGTTPSVISVTEISTGVFSPAVYNYLTNIQGVPGAYYVYPQHLLNIEDFLDNWKPSWAYALLPFHPEYCYLGFLCNEYDDVTHLEYIYDSGIYDQNMQNTNTYADALAAGYLNPLNNSIPTLTYISPGDPFYTYLFNVNPTQAAAFKASITSYAVTTSTSNLWDLAFTMVYCPSTTGYSGINSSGNNIYDCINTTHSTEYFGNDVCRKDEVWRMFRNLYLANKAAYFDRVMTKYAIENGCYNGCIGIGSGTFDKTAFAFDCYPKNITPYCSGTHDYEATADDDDNLNQPCSDNTASYYADKNKVFTTIFEDYSPANFPPSPATVNAAFVSEINTFCTTNCDIYADAWIAQLSGCSNIISVQTALKAELVELCMLQCDPLNTTFPTLTTNGNATVEEVVEYHIMHVNYAAATTGPPNPGCHPMLLVQPGPTSPIYAPNTVGSLDDCGCDKVLQNEYDFINVTLPAGVTTAEELFYYNNGFLPVNYQNINCECNSAASTWSPGHTWTGTETIYLSTLSMPVMDELTCDACLSCSEISSYQTDFDLTANYGFLASDPSYFIFLANFINTNYGYDFSSQQVKDFIDNCDLLSTPGNTVWGDTDERLHLEMLLKKMATWGDLLETTPFDLLTYIGTTSLQLHTADYYAWSTATNNCTNNTLELNVGTSGGTSQCTITLDLTAAKALGFNIDFCNIIKLENLRKRGTTCANKEDFYIDATIIDGLQSVLVTIEGTSTCYPIATCASTSSELVLCKNVDYAVDEDECTALLVQTAENNALQAYLQYLLDEKNKVTAALKNKCMSAEPSETFDMTYWDQEHHFTLYYYDQSGSLVQTVSPAGVKPFASPITDIATADGYRISGSGTKTPPHVLETKYRYNSYNQLTEQKTPDAGKSNFWYDIAGRLIASQNAQQAIDELYSYTIYDSYGRIIEVGEKDPAGYMTQIVAEDPTSLATWYSGGSNSQITRTFYDEALDPSIDAYFANGQENLRLRVATVAYYETYATNLNYDNAIHYSYDIAGNVKHAIMENTDLSGLSANLKNLSYNYDLVSGNVNQVIFQEGETDQYFHKYIYDADNRIKEVFTSRDAVIWEKDAKYFYYDHGPLARIELGDEKVQGIDLAYTIQGWLKGVNNNTLDATRDIGKDAEVGYLTSIPVHQSVSKDAFGYTLSYFNGDYSAISQPLVADNFEATVNSTIFDVANSELFNGNIRSMVTAVDGMDIFGNNYKYDQLNRLRTSTIFNNIDAPNNKWPASGSSITDYYVDITYDANGNILTLERNGNSATQLAMDDMDYTYYSGTNRLADVNDIAADHASYDDIKSSMATNNFTYDAIGNLIADPSEQIDNIAWTVYGKVKSITRINGGTNTTDKPDLEFKYDAMGNRIMKLVKPRTSGTLNGEATWIYNYYQYDAGGNLLAIYEKTYSNTGFLQYIATYKLKEVNLYGSSRLGIDELNKTLVTQPFSISGLTLEGEFTGISVGSATVTTDDPNLVKRILGDKTFELSNHLGNVLATVSDKKIPVTGSLDDVDINSGFEGGDYNLFVTGDYSALQSAVSYVGSYSINTSYPSAEFGPAIEYEVEEGDIIDANIYAKFTTGSESGLFVIGLKDKCTGAWIGVTGNGYPEWYATKTTNFNTWTLLNHSYTIPANLESSQVLVSIGLWNPSSSGNTYFDELDITITPNRILSYEADIKSRQHYYPFGSVMPNGNNLNIGDHTYGFSGMEKDDEVKGVGNSLDFGARMYDSRLGRWFAVDPVYRHNMASYLYSGNNPIIFVDPAGETEFYFNGKYIGSDGVDNNLVAIIKSPELREKIVNATNNVNYFSLGILENGSSGDDYFAINADILKEAVITLDKALTDGKTKEFSSVMVEDGENNFRVKGQGVGDDFDFSTDEGAHAPLIDGSVSIHSHPTGTELLLKELRVHKFDIEPSLRRNLGEKSDEKAFEEYDMNIIVGKESNGGNKINATLDEFDNFTMSDDRDNMISIFRRGISNQVGKVDYNTAIQVVGKSIGGLKNLFKSAAPVREVYHSVRFL